MAENKRERRDLCPGYGKLTVIGIGPGDRSQMTEQAVRAIEEADVIAGYETYLALIKPLLSHKEIIGTGMRGEVERCRLAIEKAQAGYNTAVISSGDPGVYGMAGLILEMLSRLPEEERLPCEVIPGITAANACAALLGAPLMHDYAVISLSDWLTPWELIEKRVRLAAEGDFVLVIYNPRSSHRPLYLKKVQDIVLSFRKPDTPVGFVRKAGREGMDIRITTLDAMDRMDADMQTTVIIGNSHTFTSGNRMITPRGYTL